LRDSPSTRALRHLHSCPTRRSSDLAGVQGTAEQVANAAEVARVVVGLAQAEAQPAVQGDGVDQRLQRVLAVFHGLGHLLRAVAGDRKSTRLNSSHVKSSYAVFCLKK